VQNLSQQVDDLRKKLTALEGMALAPSGDDRVPSLLSDLQEQLGALKTDVTACKVSVVCVVLVTINMYRMGCLI